MTRNALGFGALVALGLVGSAALAGGGGNIPYPQTDFIETPPEASIIDVELYGQPCKLATASRGDRELKLKLTGEGRVVMWPFGDHAAGDEEGFHELDTTGYEVRGGREVIGAYDFLNEDPMLGVLVCPIEGSVDVEVTGSPTCTTDFTCEEAGVR